MNPKFNKNPLDQDLLDVLMEVEEATDEGLTQDWIYILAESFQKLRDAVRVHQSRQGKPSRWHDDAILYQNLPESKKLL